MKYSPTSAPQISFGKTFGLGVLALSCWQCIRYGGHVLLRLIRVITESFEFEAWGSAEPRDLDSFLRVEVALRDYTLASLLVVVIARGR